MWIGVPGSWMGSRDLQRWHVSLTIEFVQAYGRRKCRHVVPEQTGERRRRRHHQMNPRWLENRVSFADLPGGVVCGGCQFFRPEPESTGVVGVWGWSRPRKRPPDLRRL